MMENACLGIRVQLSSTRCATGCAKCLISTATCIRKRQFVPVGMFERVDDFYFWHSLRLIEERPYGLEDRCALGALRLRRKKSLLTQIHELVCVLNVQWYRVMNPAVNVSFCKGTHKCVTVLRANGVHMISMF